MKKALSIKMAIVLGAIYLITASSISAEVRSLRGAAELDAVRQAADMKKVQKDSAPIKRNYVQQPPLIPHSIRGYKVNLKNNKCLQCHGWDNYREYGATKISQTHFTDRDSIAMADVAPRRYFCDQCHATQADVQPLIENNFEPVDVLH